MPGYLQETMTIPGISEFLSPRCQELCLYHQTSE